MISDFVIPTVSWFGFMHQFCEFPAICDFQTKKKSKKIQKNSKKFKKSGGEVKTGHRKIGMSA